MRRTYLDTPRGQIHARIAGDGEELILLLHQTAASSAMYERFTAAMLAAGYGGRYRFLAPDTPGFGMSFTPEQPYDLHSWAVDMVAALDAAQAGRVHLLGHHTGAAIAGVMAATRPERVASLAMIGAVAMDEADRRDWHAGVRAMVLDPGGGHLAEAWRQVGTIDADPAFAPDPPLRHRETVDKLRAGTRWHEAYLAVFATDLAAILGQVTAPTLLLCGTSDVLHPYVPATLRALPSAEFVALSGGGYVLDQNPRAVLDPYTAFLSTI